MFLSHFPDFLAENKDLRNVFEFYFKFCGLEA